MLNVQLVAYCRIYIGEGVICGLCGSKEYTFQTNYALIVKYTKQDSYIKLNYITFHSPQFNTL